MNTSEEEILSWIEMNKTLSIIEISQITGKNHKTIRKWFKAVNYTPKNHMFRKISDKDFIEHFNNYLSHPNKTLKDFCEDIKINKSSMLKRIKRLNLSTKGFNFKKKQINNDFFLI